MQAIIPTMITPRITKKGSKFVQVDTQDGRKLFCWKLELVQGLKLNEENLVSIVNNAGYENIEAVDGVKEFARPVKKENNNISTNPIINSKPPFVDNRKSYDFTREEKIKFSNDDRKRYIRVAAFNGAIAYVKSFIEKGVIEKPENGYAAVRASMDSFIEILENKNENPPS